MTRGYLLVIFSGLAAGTVLADDAQTGTLSVLTARGLQAFQIENPDAQTSPAFRLNDSRADKLGVIPAPTPGYTITSRVVVKAQGDEALHELGALGVGFAPIDASPGFYLVDAGSVGDAVWIADFLDADARIDQAYVDTERPRALRTLPTDPNFGQQWHLHNTTTPLHDVNAEPAWDAGYTGAGVTVGVLEGGWEQTHSDLSPNYNATASQPGVFNSSHGTSVAGVIAAQNNNELGGVGVAYDAQISELFFGTDSDNATAFGYRNDLNDIKNNSWGPSDNGALHDISSVELTALETAIQTGRAGLGEVFAWAAGNGGTGDRVEYDPYASSRFTTPFGAVGDDDARSTYNELGSAHLVCAQSSNNLAGTGGIYTTTTNNNYTTGFGGTSSSSPLGAGVVALMLDANPNLTWRDVQHILVETARKNDPTNPGWATNGAGRDISYDYGYGTIDAGAATALAATWTTVAPEVTGTASANVGIALPDNNTTGVTQNLVINDDIIIEHVELVINATHTYVGDLRIVMTSPEGTESEVSVPRFDGQDNLVDYVFNSRRHRDEMSAGTWTVTISDEAAQDTGSWTDFTINVYGTAGVVACSEADVTTAGAASGDPGFGTPDGAVTVADLNFFVNAWIAQDTAIADVTTAGAASGDPGFGVPDGAITVADLNYFVNAWILGCP